MEWFSVSKVIDKSGKSETEVFSYIKDAKYTIDLF